MVTFTAGHVCPVDVATGAHAFSEAYGGGSTASASLNLGGVMGLEVASITAS